jgi:pimeloyl-ACP methyl ester carboxylesterase
MKRWFVLMGALFGISGISAAQTPVLPVLESGTLERQGTVLHYWTAGQEDAPLVTFTHGATMDHRMFNAQVPALLDAGYRVLVWDVRGHGESKPLGETFTILQAAEDLLAILDELGVEQAVFVGQSMGAYIAQEIAFSYPERVHALVTVGATPLTMRYSALELAALRSSAPLIGLMPYDRFREISALNTAYMPHVQEYALEANALVSPEEFQTIWQGIADALHYEPDYRITEPLLIAYGEHDDVGSIKSMTPAWARRDTGGVYYIIPSAGHNANQDNPAMFNDLLLLFLGKHVPVTS